MERLCAARVKVAPFEKGGLLRWSEQAKLVPVLRPCPMNPMDSVQNYLSRNLVKDYKDDLRVNPGQTPWAVAAFLVSSLGDP